MTREQTIEAIKVMQAFVDRGEVEFRDGDEWRLAFIPLWQWHTNDYRIKPTLRPWTADEVPLGAMTRIKSKPKDRYVIVWVGGEFDRKKWFQEREHSTDGGKTWHPCGVMEESK